MPVARPAPGWTVRPGGLSMAMSARVLVEDDEVSRFGRQAVVGRRRRRLPLDLFAGGEAARGLCRRAGDAHAALFDPALELVARQVEPLRQEAIEPLAGRRGGNPQALSHRRLRVRRRARLRRARGAAASARFGDRLLAAGAARPQRVPGHQHAGRW